MNQRVQAIILWGAYFGTYAVLTALTRDIFQAIVILLGGAIGIALPRASVIIARLLEKGNEINGQTIRVFLQAFLSNFQEEVPSSEVGRILFSYVSLFGYGLLALYVITSTGNVFGKAVVLGCGLSLITDLLLSSRVPARLSARWFGHFKAKLSAMEMQVFVWGSVIAFIVLTFFAFRAP